MCVEIPHEGTLLPCRARLDDCGALASKHIAFGPIAVAPWIRGCKRVVTLPCVKSVVTIVAWGSFVEMFLDSEVTLCCLSVIELQSIHSDSAALRLAQLTFDVAVSLVLKSSQANCLLVLAVGV